MPRFDIEDAFQKIGRVSDVWVARKPPGFAFIEMEVNNFLHKPNPSISSKLLHISLSRSSRCFGCRTRGTQRMLAGSLMEPGSVATESRLVKLFEHAKLFKEKGKVNNFVFLARLR